MTADVGSTRLFVQSLNKVISFLRNCCVCVSYGLLYFGNDIRACIIVLKIIMFNSYIFLLPLQL